ncbi:thiopeptide-type bacteriocin biosynthesis protein [Streptosporangium saharense]|uniref:thiopeptide-type bacteriocin biosynthesis protein n=1 Tax=Streptosporangium saharense TaxID=1706840 RepID=UPI00369C05AC
MRTEALWQQANVTFADPHNAERLGVTRIAPTLCDAERDGLISSWWFIRKQRWRIRYRATNQTSAEVMAMLTTPGPWSWTNSIYEAETYAFGGPEAMEVAHALFHADSKHVLADTHDRNDRKELSILLLTAMMRAAGLDWFEQGDVWARITERRSAPSLPGPSSRVALTDATRRLLSADTRPLRDDGGSLAYAEDWFKAFEDAGNALAALNDRGHLTRGLRDLIAHHALFTWNRHGLAIPTQVSIARGAKDVVFSGPTTSR